MTNKETNKENDPPMGVAIRHKAVTNRRGLVDIVAYKCSGAAGQFCGDGGGRWRKQHWWRCCGWGGGWLGRAARGAALEQPTAYTVTVVNSMMGSPMTQTIYRNGSKAAIDTDTPAANGSPATHACGRCIYDLTEHTDCVVEPGGQRRGRGCGTGTFSGDWGDPFAGLVDVSTGKLTGTDTVNGFATKVYSVAADGATAKVWVEATNGAAGSS